VGDKLGGDGRLERQGGVAEEQQCAIVLVGAELDDLVGDDAALDAAIRRDDETVVVHAGVDAERGDQADVGALGRLDGADASVVAGVYVAYLQLGALLGQPARPQRREAPLVGQLGQRVDLVHELR
jgi:hypothetical protein